MKQSWTKGLDKERSADVKANFKESLVLRKRLKELLEDKVEGSQRKGRSESAYDNANWAYRKADQSGYERALFEVLSLIL